MIGTIWFVYILCTTTQPSKTITTKIGYTIGFSRYVHKTVTTRMAKSDSGKLVATGSVFFRGRIRVTWQRDELKF